MSTEPFVSALLMLMTSASTPTAFAAPVPFEASPAIELQLGDPDKTSEKLRGAVASLQRGDTIRAASQAHAVLREDPGMAAAHEILGSVAMIRKDWREAERELSEALRLNPRSSTALTKLGSTLLAMNRVSEASQMLRKALTISPGKGSAQRKLATIAIRQGRPEQARSEEHTSELQSPYDLVFRLLLEKKK